MRVQAAARCRCSVPVKVLRHPGLLKVGEVKVASLAILKTFLLSPKRLPQFSSKLNVFALQEQSQLPQLNPSTVIGPGFHHGSMSRSCSAVGGSGHSPGV